MKKNQREVIFYFSKMSIKIITISEKFQVLLRSGPLLSHYKKEDLNNLLKDICKYMKRPFWLMFAPSSYLFREISIDKIHFFIVVTRRKCENVSINSKEINSRKPADHGDFTSFQYFSKCLNCI